MFVDIRSTSNLYGLKEFNSIPPTSTPDLMEIRIIELLETFQKSLKCFVIYDGKSITF